MQAWIEVNNEVRKILEGTVLWLLRVQHSQLKRLCPSRSMTIVGRTSNAKLLPSQGCDIWYMDQWVSGSGLQSLHLVFASISCSLLWNQYLKSPCWILSLNFPLPMSVHAAWIVFVLPNHDPYWRPEVRKALLQALDILALSCPLDWACHIWWNRSLVCNKRMRRTRCSKMNLLLSWMSHPWELTVACLQAVFALGFWRRVWYSAVENINCKSNQHFTIWVKMTTYMSWVPWNLLKKKNNHTLGCQK
jgi:hypothetical protein